MTNSENEVLKCDICEVRLSRYDPLLFLSSGVVHTERIILHNQPAADTFRYTGIRCVMFKEYNTSYLRALFSSFFGSPMRRFLTLSECFDE